MNNLSLRKEVKVAEGNLEVEVHDLSSSVREFYANVCVCSGCSDWREFIVDVTRCICCMDSMLVLGSGTTVETSAKLYCFIFDIVQIQYVWNKTVTWHSKDSLSLIRPDQTPRNRQQKFMYLQYKYCVQSSKFCSTGTSIHSGCSICSTCTCQAVRSPELRWTRGAAGWLLSGHSRTGKWSSAGWRPEQEDTPPHAPEDPPG